jgi:hypothetical protein
MPDQIPNEPEVRAEEPELSDDALEQVAGGCQVGRTLDGNTIQVDSPFTIDY